MTPDEIAAMVKSSREKADAADRKHAKRAEVKQAAEQADVVKQAQLEAMGHYDPIPDDAYTEIDDIAEWCASYRARLAATPIAGRNRTRDASILSTLCGIMAEQKTRLIVASAEYLCLKSGRYEQSIGQAIRSLRLLGLIKKCKVTDLTENRMHDHITRYYLCLDCLSETKAPILAESTGLASHQKGDYSDDAYATKEGFSATRRKIYDALCSDDSALTVAELGKVSQTSYNTVKRALLWLDGAKLVRSVANPDAAKNEGERWIARKIKSEKISLNVIVSHNEAKLGGATQRRVENVGFNWETVKLMRKARTAAQKAPILDDFENTEDFAYLLQN